MLRLLVCVFVLSTFVLSSEAQSDENINNNIPFGEDGSSEERIGATITQIYKHPYAASILKNGTFVCSGIVLNTHWLITVTKCFDTNITTSYVTHKNLNNYKARLGSSYNNKGGDIFKIKMLINNFDFRVSAVKLQTPVEFGPRINSVRLPLPGEEVTIGYLGSIMAWTPTAHMRIVSAPLVESSICDSYTSMVSGHYICMAGVQDPNRHFCRKDDGGAIIQNDTLIGIAAFLHTCALYTKTHAFPKASSFSRWLDSVIWDENNRPTTEETTTTQNITGSEQKSLEITNTTHQSEIKNMFADPRKFLLTLPFDPVNVPLEPAEDNSVIPRMSMYESYLASFTKPKSSTTQSPGVKNEDVAKKAWFQKNFGKKLMVMPPQVFPAKETDYDY